MRRFFCRRKGSYIVEAAFIYPFIIVISAMLILLTLFLFNNTQDSARLGFHVRAEAGEASGTVRYGISRQLQQINLSGTIRDAVLESDITEERSGLYRCFSRELQRKGNFLSLFPVTAQHETKAAWTAIEEDYIIRTADLVFEKIDSI